ncbi:DUF948 domain-containing protein [Actinomadura logoneensis]|uniref:DUF948 domain-containing protein n=1 Tax=Actinomadura logoneensis TaxID=2293572 RepID=A0A372JDU6_9ACTN|nr:DUF948 domain-containing protein [Actinomadura logoneensis]RFU38183.1 DUF948 domain-containing protein [Actinomadura logoneensis]
MLTGGQLAGLIVAVFWAVLVSFLAYTLLKLARLLGEATEMVADLGEQAGPLMDDMANTLRRANEQLGRTDVITKQVGSVTQNVSAVTTVMTSVVGGPLVKAAAFSYGVRRALANRSGEERPPSRPELPAQGSRSGSNGARGGSNGARGGSGTSGRGGRRR